MDVLCALSTCPGGDLSKWGWGDDEDMINCCRPLGIEVYKLKDRSSLEGWMPPAPPDYRGLHGMQIPTFQKAGTGQASGS